MFGRDKRIALDNIAREKLIEVYYTVQSYLRLCTKHALTSLEVNWMLLVVNAST